MKCEHKDCGKGTRVWLPIDEETAYTVRHPYCKYCGVVKNLSDDRPIGIGHFMNVLSSMKKAHRRNKLITDAQIRLIYKDLMNTHDFEDIYWMKKSIQKDLFIKTVKKYCSLPDVYIRSFL